VIAHLHIISATAQGSPLARNQGSEGSDLAIATCAALTKGRDDTRVLLLASRSDALRARSLGLTPDAIIAPPLGRPELAFASLGRVLRTLPRTIRVTAWGPRCARLARISGFVPERPALDAMGDVAIAQRSHAEKLDIRRNLGIPDEAIVFVGVAEPACRLDAFFLLRMVSLLDVAGRPAVALFPRRSIGFDRARRFHREIGLSMGVLLRDESWLEDASWADFAVISPSLRHARPRHASDAREVHQHAVRVLARRKLVTLVSREHAQALGLTESADLLIARGTGHAPVAKRALGYLNQQAAPLKLVLPSQPTEVAS